jgi:hypothetical protein
LWLRTPFQSLGGKQLPVMPGFIIATIERRLLSIPLV